MPRSKEVIFRIIGGVKMGVPTSWKTIEIEQQCVYGWTVEKVAEFLENWSVVKDYAYIVHDKDVRDDGTPKEPHIHCMIRFTGAVPTSAILARAKSITGNETTVTISQLERCKKWKSAIAYLTHENVQGKHVYERTEIISNYEFERDIEDAITPRIKLNKLLNDIADGKVKDYNIFEHCTVVEYTEWKNKIDNAFAYRARILMNKGDRNMKCIYIQGDSGTGKTTYAKDICNGKEYSYYVSSGSNDVLDGYGGQDALILDDLRPSALSLADLLKMLDNNTASTVKSRYRNKVLECKLIIITTTLDINTFFSEVFKEQPETAKQLRRRCELLIKMKQKTIEIGMYVKQEDEYFFGPPVPNPVAEKYGMTKEDVVAIYKDAVTEMFGNLKGLSDALDEMEKKTKQEKKDDEFVDGTQEELPF